MNKQPSGFIKWLQRTILIDPTLSIVLLLVLMIFGYLAYSSMIKEALPDLKIPMASIETNWHGAAPGIMEKEVTCKIEQELTDLDNLKRYSSGSIFSNSNILVEFEADAPLEEAMNQLRSKVEKAQSKIPKESKKPTVTQASVRNSPIATFMLYGNVTAERLNKAADDVRKKLLAIPGITKVQLYGETKTYARVQLLPNMMRLYSISPINVAKVISTHHSDAPLGVYEGKEQPLNLKSRNAIYSIDQLANLPLKKISTNKIIRLNDIAIINTAKRRKDTETSYSRNGQPYTSGIAISIIKGDGKDTTKLVNQAFKVLHYTKEHSNWNNDINYSAVSNDAQIIEEELNKTINSGWQSILVVFLTLFFLLTWREATVAALSIPITFLGSVVMLWALGYTFNVMMIIGMILALGLLVDDFILVMEGMHDGIFIKKLSFAESAVLCIKNFAIPSLSGTTTTILTFLPLAAIGGLDGKFLRSIPVTAAICLFISYVVSILLSVPLSQFLLKKRKNTTKETYIDKVTHKIEKKLSSWLSTEVVYSKSKLKKWLLIGLGVVILGLGFGSILPTTLYPLADGRNMGITLELPIDYKLEDTKKVAKRIAEILRKKPYLSSILQVVGERDFVYEGSVEDRLSISTSTNYIGYTVLYKEKKDREKLAYEYSPELREEINEVLKDTPGYNIIITTDTGASNNEAPLQINLSGTDNSMLQEISEQIQLKLQEIQNLYNIRDTIGQTVTEATIIPNQEMLTYYDLTPDELNEQLLFYLGDYKITKLRSDNINDNIEIRIDTHWPSKDGKQGGPENWREWQSIQIMNKAGKWIPLCLLASMQLTQSPRTISHKNGQRNITIMGTSMALTFAEIFDKVDPILKELSKDWPEGYEYKWSGEIELATETYGNSTKAFIIAVIAVYAVLVLQFKSFIQPVIILSTVIFGITGVCYGFMIMAYPLSFPALIGMIALAGINVNDGIVLIDTMNKFYRSGISSRKAASLGAAERFRPIVSTTLTTLFGLIPLAIADEAWRPLCSAIIFGEFLSTIAAIIITPALFTVLTKSSTQDSSF